MKYYFSVQTAEDENAGTQSDIYIKLYGERGETEVKSLFEACGCKELKKGSLVHFSIDFSTDVGMVNQIQLTKDKQLLWINGWHVHSVSVSKQPLDNATQISKFVIDSWLSSPGEQKTFDVSDGYPYHMKTAASRFDLEVEGLIYVPAGVSYNKQVNCTLTIAVNQSTIKTTDVMTGADLTLSKQALSAAFSKHINTSITSTTDISLNETKSYTDTVDIVGTDSEKEYEILWSTRIDSFQVQMGEVNFTFDVPCNKIFAGLRDVNANTFLCANTVREKELFDSIGIALTRKCNASCDMCCFECGPDKTECLDKETLFRIIKEAAQIKGIRKIGFTGGEALLYKELLLDGIRMVKYHQMQASLTSNGFWGNTPKRAFAYLQELSQAGLDSLTISVDEFHQQYVELDSIRNILRANRHVGLSISLAVGDSLGQRNALEIIKELGKDCYTIPLFLYPFMPVGRGEKRLTNVALVPYESSWRCHNARTLSILYDGRVYPCCSQAVYESEMCGGNIHTDSLEAIIHRFRYNSIFNLLVNDGFEPFRKDAAEMGIELQSEYHSACHLCHELFRNQKFAKACQEKISERQTAIILRRMGL